MKLEDERPLKGSIVNVKTLAVLPPSAGILDLTKMMEFNVSFGSSTQTMNQMGVYIPKITEELQKNRRFQIITPHEVETALGGASGVQAGQPTVSMTEAEKAQLKSRTVLQAGMTVKADGVILIEGQLEFGEGMGPTLMTGRMTKEHRIMMQVISTGTGEVIWRQRVVKSINAGALAARSSYRLSIQRWSLPWSRTSTRR